MGREIRRVPPNWQHPTFTNDYGRVRAQPMYDRPYAEAEAEWLESFDAIRTNGLRGFDAECYATLGDWAHDHPAPRSTFYRPWRDDEATWFQLWETVSEGTPVSPPFETLDELAAYLAEHGDDWDQQRAKENDDPGSVFYGRYPNGPGWGKEPAERFCKVGWAPSLVVIDGAVTEGKMIGGGKE